jgi:hypothetical protein
VDTTCCLVNQALSSTLDDMAPHEVWTGKNPSLKHLKVFGCTAYVHVPKENRSTLNKRVENFILYAIKMV